MASLGTCQNCQTFWIHSACAKNHTEKGAHNVKAHGKQLGPRVALSQEPREALLLTFFLLKKNGGFESLRLGSPSGVRSWFQKGLWYFLFILFNPVLGLWK
jgi:hypothetical protein